MISWHNYYPSVFVNYALFKSILSWECLILLVIHLTMHQSIYMRFDYNTICIHILAKKWEIHCIIAKLLIDISTSALKRTCPNTRKHNNKIKILKIRKFKSIHSNFLCCLKDWGLVVVVAPSLLGEPSATKGLPGRLIEDGEASRSSPLIPMKEVVLPAPLFVRRNRKVQKRILGANTLYKKNTSYQLGYFTYGFPCTPPQQLALRTPPPHHHLHVPYKVIKYDTIERHNVQCYLIVLSLIMYSWALDKTKKRVLCFTLVFPDHDLD